MMKVIKAAEEERPEDKKALMPVLSAQALLMTSRSWPSFGSNVTGFRIVCMLAISDTGASGNKRLHLEAC